MVYKYPDKRLNPYLPLTDFFPLYHLSFWLLQLKQLNESVKASWHKQKNRASVYTLSSGHLLSLKSYNFRNCFGKPPLKIIFNYEQSVYLIPSKSKQIFRKVNLLVICPSYHSQFRSQTSSVLSYEFDKQYYLSN